jgi:hypothetical protein
MREETALGLLKSSVMLHFEIYTRYDYYRKSDYSVSNSVLYTADDYKINERWVYKVIKRMEREISKEC